jgi:hypothetical protein
MIRESDSPFVSVGRRDGGAIETAVFVPTTLPDRWKARALTLNAHIGDDGGLTRLIQSLTEYADGRREYRWIPNRWRRGQTEHFTDKPVLTLRFENATCKERPAYMTIATGGEWKSDTISQLAKAGARAQYFTGKDDAQEEFWVREQLRLMQKIESEGDGPYSRESVYKALDRLGKPKL